MLALDKGFNVAIEKPITFSLEQAKQLKEKVEQMRFGYKIEVKLDEDDEKSEYSSILSSLDYSWCRMSSPFSKPTTQYWEASYTNEKLLQSRIKYVSNIK